MQTKKVSALALIAFLLTVLAGCSANSPLPPSEATNSSPASVTAPPNSQAIALPTHASFDYGGHSWSCDSGYTESGASCAPIILPAHATLDYGGHSWSCDSGYTQSGASCAPIILPANASLDYGGHSWSCDSGYTQQGIICTSIQPPAHASLDYSGHSWSCDSGYNQVGDSCVAAPSQASSPIVGSPACSETGSCYGDISNVTGLPKTTFVPGYFRSNGTYVGSYFRSR